MKKRLQLSFAGHLSDRMQGLYDGTVTPEGIDLYFIPLEPFQAFPRMIAGDFDCAEMSFSTYIIKVAEGSVPFIAIPVFPSRKFRHNAIYVSQKSGIKNPTDLKGRRIGVPEYTSTAIVWARGMLKDEYGIEPTEIRWVTGGLRDVGRTPKFMPDIPGVEIQHSQDKTLNDLLLAGEIDAIIAPQMPPAMRQGHSAVDRLFRNYPEVERAYYKKTGIFPIMHVVALRKDVYEEHPWIAVSLYEAFDEAKRRCLANLQIDEPLPVSLPWIGEIVNEMRELMGDDFWPYGVARNKKEIETLCEYVWGQGIAKRKVALDELFAPNVTSLSRLRL